MNNTERYYGRWWGCITQLRVVPQTFEPNVVVQTMVSKEVSIKGRQDQRADCDGVHAEAEASKARVRHDHVGLQLGIMIIILGQI
jgi:hypothetical protein